jgi:hypothetical protein
MHGSAWQIKGEPMGFFILIVMSAHQSLQDSDLNPWQCLLCRPSGGNRTTEDPMARSRITTAPLATCMNGWPRQGGRRRVSEFAGDVEAE